MVLVAAGNSIRMLQTKSQHNSVIQSSITAKIDNIFLYLLCLCSQSFGVLAKFAHLFVVLLVSHFCILLRLLIASGSRLFSSQSVRCNEDISSPYTVTRLHRH